MTEKYKRSTSRISTNTQSSKPSTQLPRAPIHIIINGVDYTPKEISPMCFKAGKERAINLFDIQTQKSASDSMHTKLPANKPESTLFRQEHSKIKEQSQLYTYFSTTEMHETDNIFNTIELTNSKASSELDVVASQLLPIEKQEMPQFINLILNETETKLLLDIPSCTVEKGTEEGNVVEEENRHYEYITEGKGKNRKLTNAAVQTVNMLSKTRITEARMQRNANKFSFASLWDMWDTYLEVDAAEGGVVAAAPPVKRTGSAMSYDSVAMLKEEVQWLKLHQNERFLENVCVMQRILANNVFNEEQKRYRGLSDPSPYRDNVEFKYKLSYLWSFANDDTKGRCVVGMCFNPVNRDIIAVGYGKFYYDDEDACGMLFIWNIKNPVQPERDYRFPSPVTAVDFSKQTPNFVAIGFYNGDIKVIDISFRCVHVVGSVNQEEAQLYEAIWQVYWYTDHDYYKGQEFLAATSQNGRICKFRLVSQTVVMNYNHMMKITAAEGKLKGIETLRKCTSNKNMGTRHSPALLYTPHPSNPNIYYIGSGEGVVHKCSKNYYHQHLDLFRAHDSPIYTLQFSPYCTKLFLTCGDDWAMRMWAEGIAEPLFEMKKKAYGVQGCAWSPSHATIIASISSNEIYLWDIQRKTYDCQSVHVSPSKARNTLIQFTPDGRCLLVADIEGNVHVFALDDMPFVPFFQENLLTQSVKRSLVTRPDLLNHLDKLGSLKFK